MAKGILKFKTDIPKKLENSILDGIYQGALEELNSIRDKLRENSIKMPVWKNTGTMQKVLKITGLDRFTRAGALDKSWNDAIDNMTIDRRHSHITFNLINFETLNVGTEWVGLSTIPELARFKNKDSGKYFTKMKNKPTIVHQGGYRPVSKGKGWTWQLNPYPGYGYWLLVDQGWGSYPPKRIITNALSTIFEMPMGLQGISEFKFDNLEMTNFSKRVVDNIQKLVDKG